MCPQGAELEEVPDCSEQAYCLPAEAWAVHCRRQAESAAGKVFSPAWGMVCFLAWQPVLGLEVRGAASSPWAWPEFAPWQGPEHATFWPLVL